MLDINGTHALCCAPGECTRGHNEVRDAAFDLTIQADAAAGREVLGLLGTAPSLRPTDILNSAVSPSITSALHVGVAAPYAAHAGEDCCETMRVCKFDSYRDYLAEFEHKGIAYKPLVWTCWGVER